MRSLHLVPSDLACFWVLAHKMPTTHPWIVKMWLLAAADGSGAPRSVTGPVPCSSPCALTSCLIARPTLATLPSWSDGGLHWTARSHAVHAGCETPRCAPHHCLWSKATNHDSSHSYTIALSTTESCAQRRLRQAPSAQALRSGISTACAPTSCCPHLVGLVQDRHQPGRCLANNPASLLDGQQHMHSYSSLVPHSFQRVLGIAPAPCCETLLCLRAAAPRAGAGCNWFVLFQGTTQLGIVIRRTPCFVCDRALHAQLDTTSCHLCRPN